MILITTTIITMIIITILKKNKRAIKIMIEKTVEIVLAAEAARPMLITQISKMKLIVLSKIWKI